MTGTLVLSGIYQYLAKVERAPFGPREVWTLLIARGVGGFFGGQYTIDPLHPYHVSTLPVRHPHPPSNPHVQFPPLISIH